MHAARVATQEGGRDGDAEATFGEGQVARAPHDAGGAYSACVLARGAAVCVRDGYSAWYTPQEMTLYPGCIVSRPSRSGSCGWGGRKSHIKRNAPDQRFLGFLRQPSSPPIYPTQHSQPRATNTDMPPRKCARNVASSTSSAAVPTNAILLHTVTSLQVGERKATKCGACRPEPAGCNMCSLCFVACPCLRVLILPIK